MEASVSEIHQYPLRPDGYYEPLFSTAESRSEIAEHLLRAPWLSRASEIKGKDGRAVSGAVNGAIGNSAHVAEEPVLLRRYAGGRVEIVRPDALRTRRCSWRRRRVVEVLMRWREVSSWWCDDEYVDRLMFRVVVDGDGIVDLALDCSEARSEARSGEWTLAGIVD